MKKLFVLGVLAFSSIFSSCSMTQAQGQGSIPFTKAIYFKAMAKHLPLGVEALSRLLCHESFNISPNTNAMDHQLYVPPLKVTDKPFFNVFRDWRKFPASRQRQFAKQFQKRLELSFYILERHQEFWSEPEMIYLAGFVGKVLDDVFEMSIPRNPRQVPSFTTPIKKLVAEYDLPWWYFSKQAKEVLRVEVRFNSDARRPNEVEALDDALFVVDAPLGAGRYQARIHPRDLSKLSFQGIVVMKPTKKSSSLLVIEDASSEILYPKLEN